MAKIGLKYLVAAKLNEDGTTYAQGFVVGLYMPQGVAEGITKGKQDVTDAVVDMAESALTAAQETLEIHSPSKKFRKAV